MRRFALFCLVGVFLVLTSGSCAAWWNDDYDTRFAVNDLVIESALDANAFIRLNDIDFSAMNIFCADLNDLRIVDENGGALVAAGTELKRDVFGTNTSSDGNMVFELLNPISADTHDGIFYVYTNNTDCLAATRLDVLEDFEDITSDGWTEGVTNGTMESQSEIAIAGKALKFVSDASAIVWHKTFTGVTSCSLYMRAQNDAYADGTSFKIYAADGVIGSVLLSMTGDEHFWYEDGSGWHDTGVATDANTWYWFAYEYVDATHFGLHIWNETKAVEIWSGANLDCYKDWDADAIIYILTNTSETSYYDELTARATITVASNYLLESEEMAISGFDLNVWRVDGYDIVTQEFPIFNYATDANLTIDFNVFNQDNNWMKFDLNYSDSATQGTGTVIVEGMDLNLISVCGADTNFALGASCSWDWNISGVPDGNYYLLFDLNSYSFWVFTASNKTVGIASPTMTLQFNDENSFVPLIGLSVLVGGTTYTTNSAGIISVDLEAPTPTVYTIEAWEDNNYGRRYFEFDVNRETDLDANLFMLRDVNGIDFDFKFYESDGTTVLATEKLYVLKDGNYVSIRSTDALGLVSFFLAPDTNYYFVTEDGYTYYRVRVTIEIPKDESTLADVTPFTLTILDLASRSFSNYSATIETFMFPNTINHYLLDLNASQYYSRRLSVNYKGNPLTDSIQMFFPSYTDGISTIFYTKDASNLSTVSDILIECYKAIIGYGEKEIQSLRSDGAGTIAMSFIIGDAYTLKFYDADNSFLFSKTLRPEFTSYYAYIDTGDITWTEPTIEYITISGFPKTGYIKYDSTGYDFNVEVSVTGGTIATSWFTVWNNVADTNLTFNTSCGPSCGYHVAYTDLNTPLEVCLRVYVVTASGLTHQRYRCFVPLSSADDDFIYTLQSAAFRREWGCSSDTNEPCFFLLMLSAFLTIAVLATAGAGITTDTSALSIIAMICLSLFTYLTWIPFAFFILACLGAFGAFVISRRGF